MSSAFESSELKWWSSSALRNARSKRRTDPVPHLH
jgi:hypothetical protein